MKSIHPVEAMRTIAREIAADAGLKVDEESFDAVKAEMDVQVDSNVKLPVSNKKQRDRERRQRIFRNYADAYEAVHTARPHNMIVLLSGAITWDVGPFRQPAVSEKRLKELTAMLRNRLRDRH